MKKILVMILACLMVFSLCACNGNDTHDETGSKETTVPTGESTGETSVPTENILEVVKSYIDRPVEELYAVIGEPNSSDYAPSCLGDGEDGMLFYDGFIVYTYREGDVETVYDVE